MTRRVAFFGALALLAIAFVTCLIVRETGSPIPIERANIVSIQPLPYPEGSQGPPFVRHPHGPNQAPLSAILSSVPTPLPPSHCPDQGTLIIEMRSGRRIVFGRCDFPDEMPGLADAIQSAYASM
jgi:hypothetical protein